MDVGTDIRELIERARSGVPGAIGQIFEAARSQLLDLAEKELPADLRKKLGTSDIVQDTAVDMQQGFHRFTGTTTEECYAWLREVLRHNILDVVRRYRDSEKRNINAETSLSSLGGRQPFSYGGLSKPPDGSAIRREEAALVRATLQKLPCDYQKVLKFRYWGGMSFVEMAAELNRSPDAVRKLWYRAMKRLEKELQLPE